MATYTPLARSNYFRVKNATAFEAFARKWELEVIRGGRNRELYGFLSSDGLGMPPCYYDQVKGDYVPGEFLRELSRHLFPGWVAIVTEVGHEDARFLTGFSVAVNAFGRALTVNLEEIHAKAKRLGREVTPCRS